MTWIVTFTPTGDDIGALNAVWNDGLPDALIIQTTVTFSGGFDIPGVVSSLVKERNAHVARLSNADTLKTKIEQAVLAELTAQGER